MNESLNASLPNQRLIGRLAWVMAWVGLVVGQLHAMARHATSDGAEDLALPLTRAWSEPVSDVLSPLLGWASADTVYLTYGKIWVFVFLAFTLCAFVVYRRRQPAGFEKWVWRVLLTGYVAATVSVFGQYYGQWTSYNMLGDLSFALTVPSLLVVMLGSTVLGIALLRNRFRPRATAALLALQIPLAVGILQVTSMGNAALPVMFAFGIAGRRIARERTYATATSRVAA
ncbi:MAG TPA: hypothetical protein VFG63_02845 [Nocardioidaceae bacterium]|nr:hypothetical protein [Nocardioidaceae bacterium]